MIASKILQRGLLNSTHALRRLTTEPVQTECLIEDKKSYVILRMNKPSTNSLNVEYLDKLVTLLDDLEEVPNVNGVILTSNLPNIFSSGLDLNEMYKCDPKRLTVFWRLFQEFWIKLYGSNKVFIAAINGHAPAAGCHMAMSCDYRIMAKGNYTIGISAVKLGIQPPFWIRDTMINTIGHRETEKCLQLGHLFDPEGALRVKLVDEIVEQENLLARAEEEMQKWLKIPNEARQLTKAFMRKDTMDKLLAVRDKDVKYFLETTTHQNVQEPLGKYLEALKSKKN